MALIMLLGQQECCCNTVDNRKYGARQQTRPGQDGLIWTQQKGMKGESFNKLLIYPQQHMCTTNLFYKLIGIHKDTLKQKRLSLLLKSNHHHNEN